MTKMKSYRMELETIRMIKFLCEKIGYSETELIKKAIFEMLWRQTHYNANTGEWIEWNREEFWGHTGQQRIKAANHLDKLSDQY